MVKMEGREDVVGRVRGRMEGGEGVVGGWRVGRVQWGGWGAGGRSGGKEGVVKGVRECDKYICQNQVEGSPY